MSDEFDTFATSLNAPASDGFAITPHDTNEVASVTRGVYVGGDGDVCLVTKRGTTLTFKGLSAGTILPVRAKIVKATGTTATNLIGVV